MKRLLVSSLMAFAGSVGSAMTQDENRAALCQPDESVKDNMVKEHGEVPLLSIRDPNNNDLYAFYVRSTQDGQQSWSLIVSDPEQADPSKEACLVNYGSWWKLNTDVHAETTLSDEIIRDLTNAFTSGGNCISEEGFVELAGSNGWQEKIIFSAMMEDQSGGPSNVVVTRNQEGGGFIGLIQALPDQTSLHPYALRDNRTYCQIIAGKIEIDNTEAFKGVFVGGQPAPEL